MIGVKLNSLCALGKLVPIILLSNLTDIAIPDYIRTGSRIQVLRKPIDSHALLQAVECELKLSVG
jgi:FixJ family two-component response regulator